MQVIDPRELNDLAEFAARGGLGSTVASVIFSFHPIFQYQFGIDQLRVQVRKRRVMRDLIERRRKSKSKN
jgi:hypothetical protein